MGTGASEPAGYYDLAQGRTGAELRRALHFIIAGHRAIPYSSSTTIDTSDALMVLDEDPADTNHVLLTYSGRSAPKSAFGTSAGWNREHLWPDSYGLDSRMPAYSDLHNLRPADATVNSARGNKFYDRSDTNDAVYRAPGHAEAPRTSTDRDSWEPDATEKGNIARALFYMDVRYEGERAGEPDLVLTEAVERIDAATNFMGRLQTLLEWHLSDPVDDAERMRNDKVFDLYQRNRNPFVDHPEWVMLVFGSEPPRLLIRAEAGWVRLSWDGAYSNAVLEAVCGVGLPWETVPTKATNVAGRWTISEPMTNTARFYRLRLR